MGSEELVTQEPQSGDPGSIQANTNASLWATLMTPGGVSDLFQFKFPFHLPRVPSVHGFADYLLSATSKGTLT